MSRDRYLSGEMTEHLCLNCHSPYDSFSTRAGFCSESCREEYERAEAEEVALELVDGGAK